MRAIYHRDVQYTCYFDNKYDNNDALMWMSITRHSTTVSWWWWWWLCPLFSSHHSVEDMACVVSSVYVDYTIPHILYYTIHIYYGVSSRRDWMTMLSFSSLMKPLLPRPGCFCIRLTIGMLSGRSWWCRYDDDGDDIKDDDEDGGDGVMIMMI